MESRREVRAGRVVIVVVEVERRWWRRKQWRG